jgi:site-specific recombinase XerD
MGKKIITARAILDANADCELPVILPHGAAAEIPGLDPYAARWVHTLRQCGCTENTVTNYFNHLRDALALAASVLKERITIETLPIFGRRLDALQDVLLARLGWSQVRVNVFRTAIQSFALFLTLRDGIRCDWIIVWKPRPARPSRTAKTGHFGAWRALQRFIAAENHWLAKRDHALLLIADLHEVKWSGALHLKGEALDRSTGTLELSDHLGRHHAVRGEAVDALVEYVKLCPYRITAQGPLFLNEIGRGLTVPVLQKALKKWRRKAGIDQALTQRSFRGSKIIALFRQGANDKEVRARVGVRQTSHLRNSFDEVPISSEEMGRGIDNVTTTLTHGVCISDIGSPSLLRRRRTSRIPPSPRGRRIQKNKRPTYDPDIRAFLAKDEATSVCVSSLRTFDVYLSEQGISARAATLADLNGYLANRAVTCKKATIHQYCVALYKFYEDLFRAGNISSLPTVGLDRPGAIDRRPMAADPELVRRWIIAVEAKIAEADVPEPIFLRVAALIPLFALEDARFEAVRQLTADGIGAGLRGSATFQAHTKAVLGRLAGAGCTGKYLFPNRADTAPALRQSIAKWIERAAPLLGLPKVSPRTLMQCRRRLFLEATSDVNLAAISAGIGPQNLDYLFAVGPPG